MEKELRLSRRSQMLATIERMTRQKLRRLHITILEICVPLFFAIILVLVCSSFKVSGGFNSPISYNQITILRHPFSFLFFSCYDKSDGKTPIPGLLACQDIYYDTDYECYGPTPGVPFDNLCIYKFPDYDAFATLYSIAASVLSYPVSLYDPDNLIVLQWLFRAYNHAYQGTSNLLTVITQALSNIGLGSSPYNRFDSFQRSGLLYFAPAANVPDDLITYLNESSQFFRYVYGGIFDTVEEAEEHVSSGTTFNWGIIVINSDDLFTDFDVEIRMNQTALPRLNRIVIESYSGSATYDSTEMYMSSGFVMLQKKLYDYVLERGQVNGRFSRLNYDPFNQIPTALMFPQTPYSTSLITQQAGPAIPFVLVLSFLFTFTQMVQQLVHDKELRIREATLIMGLKSSPLYLSYFIVYAFELTLIMLLMTIIVTAGITPACDAYVLFLFLFLFGLTLIPLSGVVASFFSNTRLATIVAPLAYFIMTMIIFLLNFATPNTKVGISIFSPAGIGSFLTTFLDLASGGGFKGKDISNEYLNPIPKYYAMMLTIDFFVYIVLMLYLDAVVPNTFGSPRHPLFFIIEPIRYFRRCCCGKGSTKAEDQRSNRPSTFVASPPMTGRDRMEMEPMADGSDPDQQNFYFSGEFVPPEDPFRNPNGIFDDEAQLGRDYIIEVDQVAKQFKRNGKVFFAVDHLSWTMNRNEISVLLGPNGAGKSTLVNILTGMTAPTEGDCYINGYSVRNEMNAIRRKLGFCPQHNILWPFLTCREHLEYFGKVKGFFGADLEDAIIDILEQVQLLEKIDVMASALSGGQKRKLSVALAFIGNNDVVILDEPTAGMDSSARRATWRLLRFMSTKCSILLTTHYMDEADLLGDRIGIVDRGRLQCCGPALLLKAHHGAGYTLRIELQHERYAEPLAEKVEDMIRDVRLINMNGREMQFGITKENVRMMPEALKTLQRLKEQEEFGIEGFSVSASTLEEVFLSVIQKPEENDISMDNCSLKVVWEATKTGNCLARGFQQFGGLIKKRFFCSLRDRKMQFFQIVFPVVVVLLSMLFQLVHYDNSTIVDITPDMYNDLPVEAMCSNAWNYLGNQEGEKEWMPGVTFRSDLNFYFTDDFSLYLSDTRLVHEHPRFFAIQGRDSFYMSALVADFDTLAVDLNGLPIPIYGAYFINAPIILYNTSSPHSLAVGLQVYYRTLMANLAFQGLPDEVNFTNFRVVNNPMPRGVETSTTSAVLVGLILIIPFMFLPSTPVAWVVMERACKARHLQRIYGTRTLLYWLSNFLFDIICFAITVALCVVVLVIFQRKELIGTAVIGPFLLTCTLYGISSILSVYCFGFLFKEFTAAQQLTMLIYFITGFLLMMIVLLFSMREENEAMGRILRYPFRIFPGFCFSEVVMNLSAKTYVIYGSGVWALDVVGYPCIYMAAEIPVYIIIILLVENPYRSRLGRCIGRCLCCCRRKINRSECPLELDEVDEKETKWLAGEDADVRNERKAVYELERQRRKKGHTKKKRKLSDGAIGHQYVDRTERQKRGYYRRPQRRSGSVMVNGEATNEKGEPVGMIEQLEAKVALEELVRQKQDDVVRIVDLRKVYGSKKVAVRSLTFSVPAKGVFAFLGTNGAGKTTSLSILCQEQLPSRGHAFINDYDIIKDSRKALKQVGYCPQFDATLDLLTVEEHLKVYSDILCISSASKKEVVEKLLFACQLLRYRKVLSKDLSGGNRRKLSVAISLLNAPTLLCLDEPSAGMDPVARRGLWDTISIIADYCAVMLTTHHLEEVEALADRVAIMAGGRLRCIGSLAHIKEVYGCGYEICLNVDTRKLRKKQLAAEQRRIERASRSMMTPQAHEPMDEEGELETVPILGSPGEAPKTTRVRFSAGDDGDAIDIHHSAYDEGEEEMDENDEPIMRFMEKHLPAAQLREKFRQERYVFSMRPPAGRAPKGKGSSSLRETDKVTQQNFLPRVFELLLTHQEEYCISHFSVSQASIEQVFLRFCDEDENEGNNNYLEEEEAAAQETESESSLPSEEEIELESHEPDSLYASHVPSNQETQRLPHRERPPQSMNTPPIQPFKPLGKSHNRQLFLLDGEEEVDLSYRRHAGRHPAVDQSDSWAEVQMSSNVFPPPPHSHVHSDAAEQYDIQYSNYEDIVPPEEANAFVRVETSDSQAKESKKTKTSSSEDHQYEAQFSSKSY